jgi:hypothetical protein
LKEKYPFKYLQGLAKKLSIFKSSSFGEQHFTSNSNEEDLSENSPKDSGTDDRDDTFHHDENEEHEHEEKEKGKDYKEGPGSETIISSK